MHACERMEIELTEPHRSQFVHLIQCGAGAQDIYNSSPTHVGDAVAPSLLESFVERELGRVALHSRSLVPLLSAHGVNGKRVLDVGCSTGGTTVALALSAAIGANEVIGVDPNELSIAAARVRAEGFAVAHRTRFQIIESAAPLPFPDKTFDLVVAVSVLEFIEAPLARANFLSELQRVTRGGGFVYVSTPSPWRLRELHSGRWFGNFRRVPNEPWASSTSVICNAMSRCIRVPTEPWLAGQILRRWGSKSDLPPSMCRWLLALAFTIAPWRKHLFQKVAS